MTAGKAGWKNMGIRENDRESIIEGNRRDLGPLHDMHSWVRPEKAKEALEERSRLLRALAPHVETGFRGTKLDCRSLSPGCRLCGEGAWSCLFINGVCNGGCFYCPSEQKSKEEPMTGGIRFPTPREYIPYLERFGFRGVSISGGEPLLTPDRTLLFLGKIRERFGAGMYIWLYTNGLLADRDTLCRLRDIGIDEIRFNIGAVNYRLDPVLRAVGVIPRVTVEVPAVPEKEELLKEAAREMARSGVDFLNLHQIRCTPHNGRHLAARGYTLLHGPRISVLESELAALRILADLRERGIGLPVNYCSSVYRSRFQGAGAARRAAGIVRKPWEDITEAGRIRSLYLEGPPETLRRISETLPREGASGVSWTLASGGGRLLFSGDLLSRVAASGVRAGVSYFACSLHPSVTYGNPCTEVPLTRKKSVFVERRALVRDLPLLPGDLSGFERWFVRGEETPRDTEELLRRRREDGVDPGTGERERWERVFEGECIPFGPADYY